MVSPLAWVVAATFLHFASLYYLLPTLPLYVQLLGGSTSEIGLIVGAFSLASLLVRPFIGVWMHRSGRRGFLLAGAAIYVLASLGYWVIRSVRGLLLWRVFHAMGLATFSTAAASLAADVARPGRRGRTIGIFGLAQAGALAVGPGIGRIIQGALGYTGLFFTTAGTAFAALVCALALPSDASPRQEEMPGRWARSRASLHAAAVPAVVQFVASVTYGIIVSFVAVVARERGIDVVGMFFALLALSNLGVRLVAGKAYDAWGTAVVLAPAFGALAAAMALLAVAGGPGLLLLAAVPAGLGIGSTHTTLMARVADRSAHESRGSSVAGFIVCWELGVGGGSILMGRLAESAGFYVMFVVAASLPLLGLGGLPWLDDRDLGHPRHDR
jgi:predicted MFS family arabinose efflux permease